MYIYLKIFNCSGSRTDNSNNVSVNGVSSETTVESTHAGQLDVVGYNIY